MIYLVNPSTANVRAAIESYMVGAMMRPRQGNRLPADGLYAIDNACGPTEGGEPGSSYPGDDQYLRMLHDLADQEDADPCDPETRRCLFAVAPDVLADAAATMRRSAGMMALIREHRYLLAGVRDLGFPAAFVAQNGQELLPVPWDDFDALFLGGSAECAPCRYVRPWDDIETGRCPACARPLVEWKLGPAARDMVTEARRRGKWVHMGRVNSLKRLRYADLIGCDSADGTFVKRAPDKNLAIVLGWVRAVDRQAALWEAA